MKKVKELLLDYDGKVIYKQAIYDMRVYATYSGIDTRNFDDFYAYILKYNLSSYIDEIPFDIYFVNIKSDKVYLLYGSYDNKGNSDFKVLLNINKCDYSAIYDYFITLNDKTVEHYQLNSKLGHNATMYLNKITADDYQIDNLSCNYYFSHCYPIEDDVDDNCPKWPYFIKKYGNAFIDKYILSDCKYVLVDDEYAYLKNLGIFTEKQIQDSIEFRKQKDFYEDGKLYENNESAINHHKKYKEYEIDKRKKLTKVLKQIYEIKQQKS